MLAPIPPQQRFLERARHWLVSLRGLLGMPAWNLDLARQVERGLMIIEDYASNRRFDDVVQAVQHLRQDWTRLRVVERAPDIAARELLRGQSQRVFKAVAAISAADAEQAGLPVYALLPERTPGPLVLAAFEAQGLHLQVFHEGDELATGLAQRRHEGLLVETQLAAVDEKKLGITGGSGGGVLTNWAVTKPNRFVAAVSQRDISDWPNWWYTADFAQFQPSWFKGAPFEDVEGFRNRSAITHVAKIQTPMMLILGEADWRTPPNAGGEELFPALKYRKIPTLMVRFPNEGHELSRCGQPWHRIERLQHIVGWFDKWLMGMPKPEYDVPTVR